MNQNSLFIQPQFDTHEKPKKIPSSLKQAGIHALSHKGPTKTALISTENPSIEDQKPQIGLKPPLTSRINQNISIEASSLMPFSDSTVVESPHFFHRHETKSELNLRKNDIPKHFSPAPMLTSEVHHFYSNSPKNKSFNLTPQSIISVQSLSKLEKPGLPRRKTVVVDLDETLIHASPSNKNPDHIATKLQSDGSVLALKVSVRPYARDFIKTVSGMAEFIIFTASTKGYADLVIDLLDPKGEFIKKRFYRDSCIITNQGFVKDLTILRRPLKDLVIIDNMGVSFSRQKENGILISSWYGDQNDRELYKIMMSMRKILANDDLRKADKSY